MAGLRNSATYQWLSTDILGQGATGGVYRGWAKANGEPVAVKVGFGHLETRFFVMNSFRNHEKSRSLGKNVTELFLGTLGLI